MKETIYTIPVNDAFDDESECPFCSMYKKLEKDCIDYTLGPSYMEDDIRAETDKIGFCQKHYSMLYNKQNRLGLALILQSHLQKINKNVEALSKNMSSGKKGFFSKSNTENKLTEYLNNVTDSCYVCDKIKNSFDRYFDTFFYMWKKDDDIKNKVKGSKGFCIEHFSILISYAENKLSKKEYEEFLEIVLPLQKENMKRLLGEVDHFINKFDHNYADSPWGTAKDSLIRAILKASSVFVEE